MCIGTAIVWGVARDGSVWFRQGVRSDLGTDSSGGHLARGTKWIRMVGEAAQLTVGPGDQLLAVAAAPSGSGRPEELPDARPILFRTGVSPSDVCGKTWRAVTAVAPPCRRPSHSVPPLVARRRTPSAASTASGGSTTARQSQDREEKVCFVVFS